MPVSYESTHSASMETPAPLGNLDEMSVTGLAVLAKALSYCLVLLRIIELRFALDLIDPSCEFYSSAVTFMISISAASTSR